ncbi:MAG TPA: amidohydrolase [Gaiellales bacterium]
MILEGGTVLTGDPRLPRARAVAIAGTRIAGGVDVREGDLSMVSSERVDLGGRCVTPGFHDAHVHFLEWALARGQVDLASATSAADVYELLRQAPAGSGWVLAHSLRDDLPASLDPLELDAACAGRPCVVAAHDRHTVVATAATGDPAGLLREHAASARWEQAPLPGEAEIDAAVRKGVREAYRRGLTGVHDFQRSAGFAAWQRLSADGALAFRVWASLPVERLDDALALGLRSGLGDDFLRVGPIKAFADGALGSRSAAMIEPYSDGGHGLRLLEPGELREIVARASRGGLEVAVHAIGDRANHDVLDALEATHEIWGPLGLRPRIEHAQLLQLDDIPRFASLGVTASMQPSHRTADLVDAQRAWGEQRMRGGYAFATLRADGAPLCFGSDAPIEELAPLAGVRSAVEGGLAIDAALDGFWLGAARARHAERTLGRLVPGALADLVVLDRDPTSCPVDEIDRIEVVATMVGGRWVHGAPPW